MRRAAVLGLIVLAALILRVIGLQYGLPAVYNPDEVAIMARALSFAKGSLNPHNFLYPTFYFYVLFAWVGIYLGFVRITGRAGSMAALQRLYFTDPAGIYTAGRLLGAVSGAATVLLVHRLASRLTDARAALAAAVFLAAAPLAVRDSHYVKHDIFATMVIVMAYIAMARVWPAPGAEGATRRNGILAGAACGIAFSTHYYCIFLALPLSWVIIQASGPRGWTAVFKEIVMAGEPFAYERSDVERAFSSLGLLGACVCRRRARIEQNAAVLMPSVRYLKGANGIRLTDDLELVGSDQRSQHLAAGDRGVGSSEVVKRLRGDLAE